jgi:hypothetical protein
MPMVPYLRAVFKPAFKVNELLLRRHRPTSAHRSILPCVAALHYPAKLEKGAKEGQDELVGFLRGESCNIYARAERILA